MNYPDSQWERIMKIQDVFERANRKTLTWREAAEILKVDERTIRRWKQTVELNGYEGLLDRRIRHPSPKRAPETIQNQVLKLYRDQYKDWNVQHFYEQLAKYGIGYKYTWVKNLLQGAGYRFVPAGVYEEESALCLHFGPEYSLDLPPGLSPDEKDAVSSRQVMSHIAPLLPVALRGEFT